MAAPAEAPSKLSRALTSALGLIVLVLAAMWVVEVVDTYVLDDRLQREGIQPRETDGLDGIAFAPFLHGGWGHLVSNTIPFAVLGALVAIRGRRRWVQVTLIVVVVGGLLTWVFAGSGNHIGASGLVFGYFGALIGAAIFERRPASMAPALVALVLYSGIIVGLVPQDGVSWEGHLFGAIAGLAAAKVLTKPRPPSIDDEEYPELA